MKDRSVKIFKSTTCSSIESALNEYCEKHKFIPVQVDLCFSSADNCFYLAAILEKIKEVL